MPTAVPKYTVTTTVPSVAITGISPTGTFDVDKSGEGSGHTGSGATPSYTATTANVYFKCTKETYLWIYTTHNYTRPAVTLTLSNIGNAKDAKLSFGSSSHVYNSSTQVGSYSWTTNGTCSRNIGYFRNITGATDNKTPAGTITATELVLSHNGVEYTVPVTITINNPY